MPSPTCEVKDGAGAYTATTNGVNVTPGNTVTIHLVSSAGVNTWSITCTSTDELSVAATVTASLTIDAVAKTATFTAPSAGRAYIFQSVVNGGVDVNGVAQSSYTTTFGVYTRTAAPRRVHAVGETFESHATFGWVADINDVIRNPAVGSSTFATLTLQDASLTDDYNIVTSELAATRTCTLPALTGNDVFVFEAHTQTLTNKTLTTATLTTPRIPDSAGGQFYNFAVSNLAADRTVTLPLLTAGDTFVFEAHTQTLTNKTLTSPTLTTPRISDSSGGQAYVFAGSDLAADRTVTLPLLTAGDTFVFEAHTQTLTNKTLTSPTLGGTVTFSATSMQATGNARMRVYSDIANVQTTDATVTSLYTWTILDEACTVMTAEVNNCLSTGATTAGYVRRLRFKRDGGTVTAGTVDTTYTDEEAGFATCDCTIDNSTSTGRVRVTGIGANTIDWGGSMSRTELTHA